MQIVKNGLQPTVSPFILTIVGTLRPVAFRPICFHIDETISLSFIGYVPLPQPIACCVLPYGIVVEPSPIRSLVADCPMIIIFKRSHLSLFHLYVVVYNPLRVFQQFDTSLPIYYYIGGLSFNPFHSSAFYSFYSLPKFLHRLVWLQKYLLRKEYKLPFLKYNSLLQHPYINSNLFIQRGSLRHARFLSLHISCKNRLYLYFILNLFL